MWYSRDIYKGRENGGRPKKTQKMIARPKKTPKKIIAHPTLLFKNTSKNYRLSCPAPKFQKVPSWQKPTLKHLTFIALNGQKCLVING